ncbi:MAG TPA: TonB-dependent receptor [Steroidobacteraceae bacterium]|jgi:outer membrane receptor protein involved in Fe transport
MTIKRLLLAAVAVAITSHAALAQQTPVAAAESDAALTEIVVTGSRIARPELERLQPTTVIGSDLLDKRQITNVVDALDELPAFGQPDNSRVGAQSSFGIGQSFANFFSLGSQRTLTLVDGRRFVPANAPSIFGATGAGGEQVDLNVIPTQLIDRVETIAIGGAPIYGSDAIAGTVNIILKHDFEGLLADASAGVSNKGDAPEERLRLLGGKNFADGRGNIELSAEMAYSGGLNGIQRQRYRNDDSFILNTDAASPFQYVLSANQRLASISTQGVPMTDDGYLNITPQVAITSPSGQTLSFNHGSLAPYNVGPAEPSGLFNIGGDGLDFSRFATLLSPQERINSTLLGNFEFNEHAKLYGEFWYSETHTAFPAAQGNYDTALFGPAGVVNGNLIISATNPFLSAADQATIARNLAAYAAIPGNPTQTSVFYLARLNQDIGNGGATADQNTKRGVLGIKGALGFGDWKYDVSGNYGQTVNSSTSPSLNFQNYTNALNAVVGPDGSIICAPGYTTSPVPTQSSTCAPFNPFGYGIASRAANAYVTDLASAVSTLTQRDLTAVIDGTLFKLPAGAVKVVAGYENRRESADFEPDQFYQQGVGYSIPIGPTVGSFLTNEFFGEALVPLVSPANDIPFVHRLELEGAAREVDHSVAGHAMTWTAGARYEPVGILQIRGNYTRAIRAPSVTEAFTPTSQAFDTASDPCDHTLVNTGPDPATRAKNCAAAGITQPFTSNIISFTEPITVSGDPTLQNEIADSRTVGFLLRPLPRMSLAIDYVSIDIENVITTVNATDVLDACYDNPSFPNADCDRVSRTVGGANNGQITLVKTGFANEGFQTFNGVQTQFDYSFDLPGAGRFGAMDVRLNHFFMNHNTQSVGSSDFLVLPGQIGFSKHKAVLDLTWSKDPIFALWQTRYIGKAAFDNTLSSTNSQITGVGAWWVNDLTLGYSPVPNLKMQLVVDNVFDRQAPFPLPATPPNANDPAGSGTSTYFSGIMGRYFVLSISYKL